MQELKKRIPRDNPRSFHLWTLPAGMVSGIVAQVLTYPGDTVRKIMMIDGVHGARKQYASLRSCCKAVYANTGLRGFYGGLQANLVRAVPESALQYALYEFLKDVYRGVR